MLGKAQNVISLSQPPGMSYKYWVGGAIMDDELMALFTPAFIATPSSSPLSSTLALLSLWDTLGLLRAIL